MRGQGNKTIWMLFLFFFILITGFGSLFYTRYLVNILKAEERKKVEMWASATSFLASPDTTHIEFFSTIIENNTTVPVILTDGNDNIIGSKNFDESRIRNKEYLVAELSRLKRKNTPIEIDFGDGYRNLIYYKDSLILTQLNFYPYIQLGVVLLFITVAYIALTSAKKAEDNQVWVGMSKETAHQLGTPTSSLAGWIEVLQQKYPELPVTKELALDVERLEKITERFSKIGSKPPLVRENIIPVITRTVNYLKSRSSSKVSFLVNFDAEKPIIAPVNIALFEWVIENISKNAIDATEGVGQIEYSVRETEKTVLIDIIDNGKGIPLSAFKKIFNPGYTTKKRGWGLGLSLVKRIIEEFHSGGVFVRYSEPGKGTCLRVVLNK